MDVSEQIKRFEEFIDQNYSVELIEAVTKGEYFLVIDFNKLSRFSPELAEVLLDQPEEVLKAFEIAIKNLESVPDSAKKFSLRFKNLPKSQEILIRDIRSQNINKLICIDGIVRQKSDVRPQVTTAKFECPGCGNIMTIIQLESKFKEPSRCGCGRKGKFRLIHKELVDAQKIVLEENSEKLEGGDQPKRMDIFLKNDLVSPLSDKKTNPGTKAQIVGLVKEVPIPAKDGGQLVRFDLIVEANMLQPLEESFGEIKITKEEKQKIMEIAKDPKVTEKLISSMAPSIYGHEKVKEAIILQLLGGVKKTRTDGAITRGDMHILLVGDPGAGKSQLLKRAQLIAPKSRYVSGKGASGAGLCVSPNSKILTNPGGIETIQKIVDERIETKKEYCPGVWKKENISDVKVQSMNGDLKIKSLKPATIWKLKAPETMVELELASGKKIELTANTKVFSIEKGKTCWKKSKYIKKGTHIATPRRLIGGKTKKEYAVDSVKSNPVIHNVKPFVKKIVDKISLKYKSTRNAAKKIGINENKLYHNWVNEKARGNIKLKDLIKLCFEAGADYKHVVKVVSLYNGKKHNIPSVLTKEFLYAAGLVAGDGDISKTKNTYSVRVSNSENKIHQIFEKTIKKEFGLKSNFTAATEKRPGATRFQSKILAEILFSLGLCQSPKSNKLFFSEKLLHLTNDLLSAYIAGLYDTDGSVCKRKTGSDCIDFTSCSEQLARQLQLVLLRYEIHSRLRKRPPTNSKIKGKYDRWVLEIRGIDEITKFYKNFQLKHPEKIKKLKKIVSKKIKSNTNIDVIPDIKDLLIPLLTEHKIAKRKIGNISNISRGRFQKLVSETPLKTNEYIKNLAFSDIFWDVVKCVRQKKTGYEYVYDLTVQNAHNFVVDGVFVHNTAAVVKDDFLRGWALEAGALVLANKGFVMIDELDKMSKEDTSAMHEALEQQSYHPNTEILFSDGSVETIGTFVDLCINNNRKRVINGKDCEILPIDEAEILTTDFQNIFPAKIDAVSRHLAPKEFLKIKYSNGRSIMVTPDHPIFVFKDGEIKTIKANKLKTGMLAPCPVKLPTKHKKMKLIPRIIQHYNNKQIQFPAFVDDSFSRLLGYITTEGHSYYNPNTRYAEIGISNTDKKITEECKNLFENIFQTTVNINSRLAKFSKKATKDMDTVRCSSIPFYSFLKENFDEITEKTPKKRTGNLIRRLEKHNIKHFLRTAFKGDGFVDSERFGFSTASYGLAKDYQDLLLQNNIWSYIATENRMGTTYHKVVVSGLKNMTCFLKNIVEKNDHRFDKLKKFCQRAEHRLNNRNPVPLELVERVDTLLKSFGLSNGYFHKIIKKGHNSNKAVVEKYLKLVELRINNCKEIINSSNVKLIRKTLKIPVQKIAKILKTSCSNVYYLEKKNNRRVLFVLVKKIANKKIEEKTKELNQLKKFILSDLQLITVKNVEIIKNKDIKWVYDITVDPTKTFISEGLVLHNSVSISKANIQATLRCETTVLAAANPKWGRFDPYEILGKQINLPSPLISRFDLIFPIRDLPNKEQDERLATFLLNLHQTSHAGACEIETDMLKKFIAYARKTCVPKLTDEALEELKNYYVRMRNAGGDEGAVKAIPITARQLEALVRLAEASAKTRLSDRVLKKDALKAIELLHFCMSQVGIDPDTGKIDIDVLTTGVSSSARSNIIIIKEIINELENKIGKTIPVEDIIKEAQEKGVSADKAEEVLEKLKRAGDIFEPKRMFVQKI